MTLVEEPFIIVWQLTVSIFFCPPKRKWTKRKGRPRYAGQRTCSVANTLAVISVRKECALDKVITLAPKLNLQIMQPTLTASDFGCLHTLDKPILRKQWD